jgi:alpha-1,3-rhamnosyl/mannosyltransferase
MTTRVGINLLWLAPGEVGGSEDYCIGLIRALARHPDARRDLDLVVYVNREVDRAYPDLGRDFAIRMAPIGGRRRMARVVAEHTWLFAATKRDRRQLVHHLGGTMPFARSVPGVMLLHDLQPWALPQNFTWVKRRYLYATVPHAVRAARAITTLSEWARLDIHQRLDVPLSRMIRLPPGGEHLAALTESTTDEPTVLARYGIDDRPFFVYPVITYPHKNHETLIVAFAQIADRHPEALLVLTGGEGPAEPEVRQVIEREKLTKQVRRVGRVPNGDLEVLYRRTTALTFPSRYEGFGMPVLEVMHHGRPVVAAAAGALPEVVGDGGALIDPDDIPAWSSALDRLLRDPAHWDEMARAARRRASTFTWEHAVDDLVDLYQRASRGTLTDVAP